MTTSKTRKETGPFADPKVRAKWSNVPGQSGKNERKRKEKMERPPFPDRVKK